MGDGTSISWTDATWNPVRGCSRVSEGCRNCYAERQAFRFAGADMPYEGLLKKTKPPRWSGEVRFIAGHLMDPFRWTRPRRIFTDSMSDLFYERVTDSMIDQVVAVMIICSDHEKFAGGGHVFQTLTKRPERMRAYFDDPKTIERVAAAAATLMEDSDGWFDSIAFGKEGLVRPNMWWGVSVENQAAADERIPLLLETPAAVRFLSCEPLIGPLWLAEWTSREHGLKQIGAPPGLHWVIAGCESGPGARPCEVAWLRSLRDQCVEASVPFFLKQAKECLDVSIAARGITQYATLSDGIDSKRKGAGVIELPYLDGVQHAAFPAVTP